MKYQIDNFLLDTTTRTLTQGDVVKNIRPKTLSLLLFIAEKPEHVFSKKELLATIWDDVSVDDGVIFQSVREIRQLFDNSNIVQNFPRKGYAFTGSFSPIEVVAEQSSSQDETSKFSFPMSKIFIGLFFLLICIITWLSFTDKTNNEFEHNVLVLPIKSRVSYEDNNWIYLGGMEQLIARLKGLPSSVFVFQGTEVPHLMYVAGIEREFPTEDVARIFNVSGASVVVETEFHGDVADYKLVYKIHTKSDVKQGVVLDTTIEGAISKLSEKLAEFVNQPIDVVKFSPRQEFSDALFAEAMISYESDWKSSVSFFESYLALNPDSIIAMIYLSKLYVWQDRLVLATSLINKAMSVEGVAPEDRIRLFLLQGRIQIRNTQYNDALSSFEQAQRLAETHSFWSLQANIAEEQGKAHFSLQQYDQAYLSYKLALSFYQILKTPIGINGIKLHLSRVLIALGKQDEARDVFEQAEQRITLIKLDFLYTRLEEHRKELSINTLE